MISKHKSSNKRLYLNKNKAQGYWNPDWSGTLIQDKSKVQNKKCSLRQIETVSSSTSRRLFYKLPLRNFRKNNRSTGQQIDRSNSGFCNKFFGLTEISSKRAKGWWNNNIKAARSVRRYKLRQSPANLRKMEEVKEKC